MISTKKTIILIFSIFCLLVFGIAYFVWQGVYSPKNQEAVATELFFIEQGRGVEEIAINLENQNLIKCQYLFKFYVLVRGVSPELQAGVYQLSSSMSISEIVYKIRAGDIYTKKITIPEGFNIRQIEERFSEVFKREINFAQFRVSDFQGEEDKSSSSTRVERSEAKRGRRDKVSSPTQANEVSEASRRDKVSSPTLRFARVDEFSFLKDIPKDRTLEGFLFPDTYQFSYLVTEEEIIREMLNNFDRRLTSEIREDIKEQGKTIFDIIIMASIIEEEVRKPEDKKIVSGVFWKRIDIGMRLQSCATIAFILQEQDWTFKEDKSSSLPCARAWTFDEMRREVSLNKNIDSLYNTYIHRGLPPGPISNPGMNSILAAVYPRASGYLFFLSTLEGETIFSRTLREHNLAKARYF